MASAVWGSSLNATSDPAAPGARLPRWREAALVAFVLAVLAWASWFRYTDARVVYMDDIGMEHVPRMAYVYGHPWGPRARIPPLYFVGTADFYLHTDYSLPTVAPAVMAALSLAAPRDVVGLARFEWRLTGVQIVVSLVSFYVLLRREGAGIALALPAACAYVFSGPVFAEWSHTGFFRALLLIPAVCASLRWATTTGGWLPWWTTALAAILCLSQTVTCYVALLVPVAWSAVSAWIGRGQPRTTPARPWRLWIVPGAVAVAAVGAAVLPVYLDSAAALADSAHTARLRASGAHFMQYALQGVDWFGPAALLVPISARLGGSFGPLVLAALFLFVSARVERAWRGSTTAYPLPALARLGAVFTVAGVALTALARAGPVLFRLDGDQVRTVVLGIRPPAEERRLNKRDSQGKTRRPASTG